MKNVLKTAFFAALLSVVACGDAVAEKEKAVVAAPPTAKPMVKETPAPVVAETATKVVEAAPIAEAPKKTPVKKEVEKVVVPTTPKVEKVTPKPEVPAKKEIIKEAVKVEPKVEIPTKEEVVIETPKVEAPKAPTTKPAPKKEVIRAPQALSHAAWNALTQKHISATGKVNYKGFKADIAAFDAYLKSLADNPVQSSWSRGQKMAYWINAYNAFTIKLIVANYPVKSIMDLEGGKPWDKKWIKLGGKTYSLNNIEHDILRPKYKDARIHFAVNCAAKSCPPVWNKAWTAANLNGQLERSAKAFINNSQYNSVGGSNAAISKIFEWYAVDFGNITDYLNKYASTKVAEGTAVTYKEYNWALNE
ncbi:MAG: DUF547 domain-containing protein [Saprospiraceae bacterium]